MRFFATCVILAGLGVGAVFGLSHLLPPGEPGRSSKANDGRQPRDGGGKTAQVKEGAAFSESPGTSSRPDEGEDKEVQIVAVERAAAAGQPLIIQGARVVTIESQDVPCEKDGKLLFLATPVGEDEEVPADRLEVREFSILGTEVKYAEWQRLPQEQRLVAQLPVPGSTRTETLYYRPAKSTDSMQPGTTRIFTIRKRFKKLQEGDMVKAGAILGAVNPALALDELGSKQAKVEAAAADVLATVALKEESAHRLKGINRAIGAVPGSVSRDDQGAAVATLARYQQEEVAKKASVVQSQRELSAALTALEMHLIRAQISGKIKTIFKQAGEAVKNNEQVMQLQNTRNLRAQAQLDVQDAEHLRKRLEKAEAMRRDAWRQLKDAKGKKGADLRSARALLKDADDLVKVEIEASRPVPPAAVLSGHLQDVTSVAVTAEKLPRIVSGSLDGTVRLWERVPGTERWGEQMRLEHYAGSRVDAVRAVAATGPKATTGLLLTGTAAGRGRLFNLSDLKSGAIDLKIRHAGAIEAVAFNAEGTRCATAGEDRVIRVWDTSDGSLVLSKPAAHRANITSLFFSGKDLLISAAKDRTLVAWTIEENESGMASPRGGSWATAPTRWPSSASIRPGRG